MGTQLVRPDSRLSRPTLAKIIDFCPSKESLAMFFTPESGHHDYDSINSSARNRKDSHWRSSLKGLPRMSRHRPLKVFVESHVPHKVAVKKPRRGNTLSSVGTFVPSVRARNSHRLSRQQPSVLGVLRARCGDEGKAAGYHLAGGFAVPTCVE